MRLLLTSAGITNHSIRTALVELLGKPAAESNANCLPTAIYALPGGTATPGRSYESWARWPGSGSACWS
jgi:dipeptidase E